MTTIHSAYSICGSRIALLERHKGGGYNIYRNGYTHAYLPVTIVVELIEGPLDCLFGGRVFLHHSVISRGGRLVKRVTIAR